MGLIFPVSAERSPLVATIYTFVVPPLQCLLAAGAVCVVLQHYYGIQDWIYIVCVVLAAGGTVMNFRELHTQIQSGGEVAFRDALLDSGLILFKCTMAAVIGSIAHPWIKANVPTFLLSHGWRQLATFVSDMAPVLAVGIATLATMFLSLWAGHIRSASAVRGKRRSPQADIRQYFASKRRAREDEREDRILRQIHIDGGTSKISASDLEFLRQRGRSAKRGGS